MTNRGYVNSICGWQYPTATIRSYLESNKPQLLTMDFDFSCKRRCNLRCRYCFVETDERESQLRHEEALDVLSVEQLKTIFTEARDLGCRSAKLVGVQEPLMEEGLLDFLQFVSERLGMWVVVFTNGAVLADDSLCVQVHQCKPSDCISRLKQLRVSIMLKFHSCVDSTEDALVGVNGYAKKRNRVLQALIAAGFNLPPSFDTKEECELMTGAKGAARPLTWTRLGLESVITPQCLADAETIYRMKKTKRLYVDLDPPVPVGLTRNAAWREKVGLHVPPETLLELAIRLYRVNEELGIPFEGASPYFGGLPCSQLPYGLYVNSRGRIYPCCGCPDVEVNGQSEYLGNAQEPNGLARALTVNPYRVHRELYGFAYDKAPFNRSDHPGYGIYHGCPYRDRAGDLLPDDWEMIVEEGVLRGRLSVNTDVQKASI